MLTMNETEAAYARFLCETNCKRLPKNAGALFTQLEKQLRTIDEAETDGYFPAIAAALFRMVKVVSQNRSLLVEYRLPPSAESFLQVLRCSCPVSGRPEPQGIPGSAE